MPTALKRETVLSADRKYRYVLWRDWSEQLKCGNFFTEDPHLDYYPGRRETFVNFIGLNPSVADETNDDATIRICRGFAQRWGFGAMCMTNLFAFRATDPKVMKAHQQPDGERSFCSYCTHNMQFTKRNDAFLYTVSKSAGLIVAVWGVDGQYQGRDKEVMKLIPGMKCLRKTQAGFPCHPLRIPYSVQFIDL